MKFLGLGQKGVYVGALVTAMVLLVPLSAWVFFPAFVLGPLAGVCVALRSEPSTRDLRLGAQLGFYSAFYGSIGAIAVQNIATRLVTEELWRFEKLYLLPPMIAEMGIHTDSPAAWYLWSAQLALIAVFAGAIGSPAGVLGVHIWSRE